MMEGVEWGGGGGTGDRTEGEGGGEGARRKGSGGDGKGAGRDTGIRTCLTDWSVKVPSSICGGGKTRCHNCYTALGTTEL